MFNICFNHFVFFTKASYLHRLHSAFVYFLYILMFIQKATKQPQNKQKLSLKKQSAKTKPNVRRSSSEVLEYETNSRYVLKRCRIIYKIPKLNWRFCVTKIGFKNKTFPNVLNFVRTAFSSCCVAIYSFIPTPTNK